MTLGRCPLGIFCSRGTPPRTRGARAHAPVDVKNESPLSQPVLSLPTINQAPGRVASAARSSTETQTPKLQTLHCAAAAGGRGSMAIVARGRLLRRGDAPFVEGDRVQVLLEKRADASAKPCKPYTRLESLALRGAVPTVKCTQVYLMIYDSG